MLGEGDPHTWGRSERERIRACAKAFLLGEPSLAPSVGRFRLVRLLGRGTHGAVYEARDLASGEQLALKILHAADAASIHAFKAEFRALAGIVHENLVQLHELFVEQDESFFTMEFVDGLDFDASLWSGRVSSTGQAYVRLREAFASLVDGVKAIHRAGKLHCDLKPSNVRVSRTGRAVVLDYGLVFSSDCGSGARAPASALATRDT